MKNLIAWSAGWFNNERSRDWHACAAFPWGSWSMHLCVRKAWLAALLHFSAYLWADELRIEVGPFRFRAWQWAKANDGPKSRKPIPDELPLNVVSLDSRRRMAA